MQELSSSFEVEVMKVRPPCQEIEKVNEQLTTKIGAVDKQEIENLELHM